MKKTIYDVAEKAGVSIATVSKVFNKKGNISSETIKKVLLAAKDLNYKPSFVASALTGKSTNTIGLLIPDIANSFYAELSRSIEDRGYELGYTVVICNTDNLPEKEARYIDWLERKGVDGIISGTGTTISRSTLEELSEYGISTALVSRAIPDFNVNTVLVDDFKIGYEATAHLLSLGHEKIGFAAGDLRNFSEQSRLDGYKAALQKHGLNFQESHLLLGNTSIEKTKALTKESIFRINEMSAIFATNDLMAIGIIQGLKELGLSIPDDMSIVGCDDTILAVINDPPLTTMAQPIQEMGKKIIDLLVDEINRNQLKKEHIIMEAKLVERRSVKPYSKKEAARKSEKRIYKTKT